MPFAKSSFVAKPDSKVFFLRANVPDSGVLAGSSTCKVLPQEQEDRVGEKRISPLPAPLLNPKPSPPAGLPKGLALGRLRNLRVMDFRFGLQE